MSPSTRVVVGTDDRGRPKAEWRPDPGDETPAYGFMEPAYDGKGIERRKATPEELAAARAREEEPRHLVAPTLAKPVVFSALQRATPEPEEEPIVSGPPADHSDPMTVEVEATGDTLAVLADAVATAAAAWTELQMSEQLVDQARVAWKGARRALDAAYRALDEPPAVPVDRDHEEAKANLIRALRDAQASAAAAAIGDAAASVALDHDPEYGTHSIDDGCPGGHRTEPGSTVQPADPTLPQLPAKKRTARDELLPSGLTKRQALAIELLQSGLTRADTARRMGTTYQTLDGLLESLAKKGRLPADLWAILPDRIAKKYPRADA